MRGNAMAHMTVELRTHLDGDAVRTLEPRGANISEVMPAFNDGRYPLLRYVDPYDDTTFTSNQMNGLLPELRQLHAETGSAVLEQVIGLAEMCHERGWYMVFIGD
jgi:hypothetical protein